MTELGGGSEECGMTNHASAIAISLFAVSSA